MKRESTIVPIALVVVALGAWGCATKGFVSRSVDEHAREVDRRVTRVEQMAEDTAVGAGRTTARLRELDDTATGALQASTDASTSAREAQESAAEALSRAEALEAAERRILFEVVLADEHGHFAFGDAGLPEPAAKELDGLVERLEATSTGIFVEVEGHTDATGADWLNQRLGLARAESVRRYLHERHHFPLHKINVISYGEDRPVAPNDTIEGRARNRRVVVRVLG